jgi:hypothetical protein
MIGLSPVYFGTAVFATDQYTINFVSADTAEGTVSKASYSFTSLDGIPDEKITAVSSDNYYFKYWTNDYDNSKITNHKLTSMLVSKVIKDSNEVYHNATFTAHFASNDETATIVAQAGEHGRVQIDDETPVSSITQTEQSNGNKFKDVTVVPDEGYYLENWTDENGNILKNFSLMMFLLGIDTGDSTYYESHTYTAHFAKRNHFITISHPSGFIRASIDADEDEVQVYRNTACTDEEIAEGNGCSVTAAWQKQWYDSPEYKGDYSSTGIAVSLNGTIYLTSYLNESYNNSLISFDSIVSQSDTSATIKYQLVDGETPKGIYLLETTYFIDAYTVGHKYELKNESNDVLSNVKIYRIGDTYYNDNDNSFAISDNEGTIVIHDTIEVDNIEVPNTSGGIAQYGTFDTKADHYYEGYYDNSVSYLSNKQDLPDCVNADDSMEVSTKPQDGGVSYQWNKSNLAIGESLVFSMYERYSTTNSSLIISAGNQDTIDVTDEPKTVTKTFDIISMFDAGSSNNVTYTATSELGHSVVLNKTSDTFTGTEFKTVIATITYPKGINPGTDTITFVAAASEKSSQASSKVMIVNSAVRSVTITSGKYMSTAGKTSQTELTGAMTDVTYTADDGYYFPEDYAVTPVNGISVKRVSASQIIVSGTPSEDTAITLEDAVKKASQDAPKSTEIIDGKGKINGTTAQMEYSLDQIIWKACTEGSTAVPAGTYYVRYAATDTKNASEAVKVTVTSAVTDDDNDDDYQVVNTGVK